MTHTKKQNRFTEVAVLDICYSDYFTGYSFPVLALPVSNQTTFNDLADEIESEINANYEYLVNESENSFTDEEIKLFDAYVIKLRETGNKLVDETLEDVGEDEEGATMFLSLCKPVTRYGMNFLNA